jgi:hypothetical protein
MSAQCHLTELESGSLRAPRTPRAHNHEVRPLARVCPALPHAFRLCAAPATNDVLVWPRKRTSALWVNIPRPVNQSSSLLPLGVKSRRLRRSPKLWGRQGRISVTKAVGYIFF